MSRVVLGVGMSTSTTKDEVRELIEEVVGRAPLEIDALQFVATRMSFVGDERIPAGLSVIGVADDVLLEQFPRSGRVGFAARVAEGCALIAAGPGAEIVVPTTRSAHATAALAVSHQEGEVL